MMDKLSGMSDTKFEIGDDVRASSGIRGILVDYRALPSGVAAWGIMDSNGRIEYHAEKAIRSSEGMTGYPLQLD